MPQLHKSSLLCNGRKYLWTPGFRSKGPEDIKSNQQRHEDQRMRCTDQQGKDTRSRSACLLGSKTLASTTEEQRWHFLSSSIQKCIWNTQTVLLLLETCLVGMGSAFQIGQGRSVLRGTKQTMAMQLPTSEGKSNLGCKWHWETSKKH